MKYLDPMPVKCPKCGETRQYPVDDLRNFRAVCSECNYELIPIGKMMREKETYWAYRFMELDFVLRLEEKLNIQYEDREAENLETLEDVFRLTLTKLPPNFGVDRLKEIIFVIASEVGKYKADQLRMEMSLRDVFEKTE